MFVRKAALTTLLLAGSVAAQEFRATLQGTITDPIQATIPKATVAIRNSETGIERSALTDDDYLFPYVAPGNYSVTVEAAGFKRTVRESVVLSVNDNIRLDLQLPLEQAVETVRVTGDLTAVQGNRYWEDTRQCVVVRNSWDHVGLGASRGILERARRPTWWRTQGRGPRAEVNGTIRQSRPTLV